jgi:hypothetical protein
LSATTPRPLAQQRAVAPGLEGPHLAATAEGTELGEDIADFRRQRCVHAAGEHHAAAPGAQFVDGRPHREQRRRAGGIHQVVGPAQIEPVGDAPGHDVGYQPRGDVGVALRQARTQHRPNGIGLLVGEVRTSQSQQLDGLVHHHEVLHDGALAAVQVGAVTQDDAGVAMIGVVAQVSRIAQRVAGDPQRQILVGLTAIQRVGHDAELGWVEPVQVAQVAASRGLDPASGQVAFGVPARHRRADGVDAVHDVAPEGMQVRRLREQARHADDGDGRIRLVHDRPFMPVCPG